MRRHLGDVAITEELVIETSMDLDRVTEFQKLMSSFLREDRVLPDACFAKQINR